MVSSLSKIITPSGSSAKPSSVPEQSIPKESSPRILAAWMRVPLAVVLPGKATGTFWPTAMFLPPQTICKTSFSPTLVWVICSLSALGCLAMSKISPTTICENLPVSITSSTSVMCKSIKARTSSGVLLVLVQDVMME